MTEKTSSTSPVRFMIFLLAFVVMLWNQSFYRYQVILDAGISWRLMDVVLLLLVVTVWLPSLDSGRSVIYRSELGVWSALALYCVIAFLAIIRGYFVAGSWAIGVGRYSLLEVLLVPIILSVITSEWRLKTFFRFISVIVAPIWLTSLFMGIRDVPLLLAAGEEGRFIDSATAFGLANVTVLLTPLVFQRSQKRILLSAIPVTWIVIFSFVMVVLLQHRSVWVSAFVGLSLVWFLSFRTRKNKLTIALRWVIVLLVLAGALLVIDQVFAGDTLLQEFILSKLAFLGGGVEADVNGFWRVRGWTYVIERTMSLSPWLGFGFSETGWIDWQTGNTIGVWEHNQYVHLLRAAGIVGVAMYLLFLLLALRFCIKAVTRLRSPLYRAIAIGASGGFLMSMVYMLFYNQVSFLWIDLAILFSVFRLDKRQVAKLVFEVKESPQQAVAM